ncbi:MAG: hypothetical protein ACE5NP_01250 [Anaerolineae bacterium]
MLPPGHVIYTWATLNLLQRRFSSLRDADYRLVALAALLPDLIDKPLAHFLFFRQHGAALLFSHTLLAHVSLLVLALRRLRHGLVYVLAFNGHALIDRLWFFPRTFLWPFLGRRFHRWQHRSPQHNMWQAYLHTFIGDGRLLAYEVVGLGLLAWLVSSYRLYRSANLFRFLRTGRLLK